MNAVDELMSKVMALAAMREGFGAAVEAAGDVRAAVESALKAEYERGFMRAYGEACAAAEREACHAIHDMLRDYYVAQGRPAIEDTMLFAALADYAAAIRARGETK